MTDPEPDIADLVAAALAVLEEQGEASFERFCGEHPGQAAELREQVRALRATGLIQPSGAADIPENFGEYRLLSRLGDGGMGVVYLAEQESLGRRVAIKLVRPELLYFESSRERFQREVEAIARLQHPGLVTIHGVGEVRGLPYFAMEWVRGMTVAAILERLRLRRKGRLEASTSLEILQQSGFKRGSSDGTSDGLYRGSFTEWCVGVAKRVAEALHHTHENGVLHRDVKPSNIMLTPEGRVVLLDFGLAAVSGSSDLTRSGAQVGSLPYMAPEQIQGDRDTVDRRTDVYGLGVTLFEMLHLEPAYASQDIVTLRHNVLHGEHAKPSRSGVPWDAATVCMTAMDQDPARRYQSAQAMAEDLDRILAKRPIQARRPGMVLRSRRFAQRRPAWTVAITLLLLAVIGIPWIVRTVHAAELERRDRQLSEFLDGVDRSHQRVLKARNLPEAQRDELRRASLQDALETLSKLRRVDRDAPRLLHRLARICARLGKLLHLLGEPTPAASALGDALEHLDALAAVETATTTLTRSSLRADCLIELGRAQRLLGEVEPAKTSTMSGLAIAARMPSESPIGLELRSRAHQLLATIHNQEGHRDLAAKEIDTAEQLLRRALAISRSAGKDENDLLEKSAKCAFLAARLAVDTKAEDAESKLRKALAAQLPLTEGEDPSVFARNGLAICHRSLALFFERRRNWEETKKHSEAAIAIADGILEKHRNRPRVSLAQNGDLGRLALSLIGLRKLDQSLPHIERALASAEHLAKRHPGLVDYTLSVANLQEIRGQFAMASRDRAGAVKWLERNLESRRVIAERWPNRENEYLFHGARARLAQSLLGKKGYAKAERMLLESLRGFRALTATKADPRILRNTGQTVLLLAMILTDQKRTEDALTLLEEAQGTREIEPRILRHPGLAPLRTHPRFRKLLVDKRY